MLASLLVVFASMAMISAQTFPANVYNGFNKWLAKANNMEDCMFYAHDFQRMQSGFGYLYYNPYVCYGDSPPNLVGCTGNLNFTTYLNYYLSANNAVPGSGTYTYYQSLISSFVSNGAPSNFNHHYQVKNCMFCKLLDSYATNLDPFCPEIVCQRYGLDITRCIQDSPTGDFAGIGSTSIAPVLAPTWDVDTEYDILFSVFGVSNTAPYVGMPLGTQAEGCPSGFASRGLDGLPTGFTFQPNYTWLKQNLNHIWINRQDGTAVHPECSLINPNGGPTERVVVLCGRAIANETNPPVSLMIDTPVQMSNGQFTTTPTMSVKIGTLNQGSLMFSAERYNASSPLFSSFFTFHPSLNRDPCNNETTKQIIMTSWTKGLRQVHPSLVAFPAGLRWNGQENGVNVGLADGRIVNGKSAVVSIHDDDDDGFIHVCLTTRVNAVNVSFAGGLFYDPRNTMNVYQIAQVTDPIPLHAPYPIVNPNAVATPTLPTV